MQSEGGGGPPPVPVSPHGAVSVISIDRPEVKNAVDGATAGLLRRTFSAFEADEAAHVAVLTGRVGAFCAGADLKALAVGDRRPVPYHGPHGPGPMGPARMTLAAFPHGCLRNDRLSIPEQWGRSEAEAAVNETRRGRQVITGGETLAGAGHFAAGAGRGGAAVGGAPVTGEQPEGGSVGGRG